MKIISVKATNFGSYSSLDFNYEDLGLCLISGPTGSGKSTFEDVATWVLFGITSKGGASDEVRRWNTTEPTTGTAIVKTLKGIVTITRKRGESKHNDLYWEDESGIHRGKDLKDTQGQIEKLLGVTKDEYIIGACYNEFSDSGHFFTLNSKDRKRFFKKIASLDIPNKIAEGSSEQRKDMKLELDKVTTQHSEKLNLDNVFRKNIEKTSKLLTNWKDDITKKIEVCGERINNFEKETTSHYNAEKTKYEAHLHTKKLQLEHLRNKMEKKIEKAKKGNSCPSCGAQVKDIVKEIKEIEEDFHSDVKQLEQHNLPEPKLEARENPYLSQLEELKTRTNPFIEMLEHSKNQLDQNNEDIKNLSEGKDNLTYLVDCYSTLYDLSSQLRAFLLENTVVNINDSTNTLLSKYFDTEIQVDFKLNNSDDLDTNIKVNGNACSYSQLSKGQRGLLKLCFAIATMQAVENKVGARFDSLFFDEALDGLDTTLKLKAYNLFCELEQSHSTVFVIDHSNELKTFFPRTFYINVTNGVSEIKEID